MVRVIAGSVLGLLTAVSPSFAQKPSARIILEHRYAELNRAMVGMNASAVEKWMAANAAKGFFYASGAGRSYTADQTVALLQSEFNGTSSVKKSDYRISNVSVHGDHASFSVTSHLIAIVSGSKRVQDDTTAIYNWSFKNGTWKATSIVTTAEKRS